MTVGKGVYRTRNGFKAVVARVRSVAGVHWVVGGAIEDVSGVLHLHHWTIDGHSMFPDESAARQWDIVEEAA